MIIDQLSRAAQYRCLSPHVSKAIDFITRADVGTLACGEYELDGRSVYGIVQEYDTILSGENQLSRGTWEAHRKYIDLQLVISGRERIGWADLSTLAAGDYNSQQDFMPLVGDGHVLTLVAGSFMLLYPWDGHMPRLAVGESEHVRKVVVKIAYEDSSRG